MKKLLVAILIIGVVVGALAGIKYMQVQALIAAGQTRTMPPETISTAVAEQQNWQGTLNAIGSITAFQGVTVTVDIPGTIRQIAFESGATVKEGDLLVLLDISTEQAQLNAILAQVDLARVNLERSVTLRKENMISQAELDAAEATLKQNQANADAIRATIEKKHIRAPFSGQLGIRQVNLGQYLDAGKPIVALQALSPIYCEFSLPQQELQKLAVGQKVRVTTDAYPDRTFEGQLTAINPQVSESTRSVRLQASFENADKALRPGMFARAQVLLPEQKSVVVIPITSVLNAPYGDSVYIVEPGTNSTASASNLVVRQQFVRIGAARGDFLTVISGVEPGQTVASAGLMKLRNGMNVVINNELKPPTSANPRPSDS